jgi:hypothetical protein
MRHFFLRARVGLLILIGLAGPVLGAATREQIKARLASEFHQNLYPRTYQSLLRRVEPDGFFQESVTGAYMGMYPRTVGALVSLFLETGELERSERLLDCVLKATAANQMERIPHVFDRSHTELDPVADGRSVVQPGKEKWAFRLRQDCGGSQRFKAPAGPIKAAEFYLALKGTTATLTLTIRKENESAPLATARVQCAGMPNGRRWVRFEFERPVKLSAGAPYVLRLDSDGKEGQTVYGARVGDDPRIGGVSIHHVGAWPGWTDEPALVAAFALDTGRLTHVAHPLVYPVLSSIDQVDGQAHVIVAWARLAQRRGATPFEERTYPLVAKLMDRTSDAPYVDPRVHLVRNIAFEHSREMRFWDAYDLLTQSFVGAALEAMADVAERRGDGPHAALWSERLDQLRRAMAAKLVRRIGDRTVYLEMLLPDSGQGVPFLGMSWVNLSPVAAQWEGLGRRVLRNTVEQYRKTGLFELNGLTVLGFETYVDKPPAEEVLGKALGWELDYARQEAAGQEGEWERIAQILDFLQAVNSDPLIVEGAFFKDGRWTLKDPGNGEQAAWYCWAMARLRKALGLPVR